MQQVGDCDPHWEEGDEDCWNWNSFRVKWEREGKEGPCPGDLGSGINADTCAGFDYQKDGQLKNRVKE